MIQKPQRRGAEVFAYQLTRSLKKSGHDVSIAFLYPYTGDQGLPMGKDDVLLEGSEHHLFETVPGTHPVLARRLLTHIRRFQPDIIQVNGARTIKYGACAKLFSASRRWRLVYRNIDNPAYWVKDIPRLMFYRKLVMPRIDGVIGVSEATLANVRSLYGVKAPAVHIPNGFDPEPLALAPDQETARRMLGADAGKKIILFMGNLTEQKRPDRFMRVIKRVHASIPEMEAWVLGDGPLRKKTEEVAEGLGLRQAIKFWGYRENIAPYIAASDLLLITSDSDGIPAVVLESGFLEKPTVSTRVGGLPECVKDGVTGMLRDAADEKGLAEATADLLRNDAKRKEMGSCAKALMCERFSMDRIARKYYNFYLEAAASRRR